MAVSKDQQKASEPAGKDAKPPAGKGKKDTPVDPDADLSEEDLELKNKLEQLAARAAGPDASAAKAALADIRAEIQSSQTAMSAVPKPLKFLVPHVDALRAAFDAMAPGAPNRPALADILSVLASTVAGKEGERLGLRYKLAGGLDDLGQWGHEYLRHISGEVAEEFKVQQEAGGDVADLMHLVEQIAPYHMSHNAEPEAVDLLLEVERLDMLEALCDDKNYGRTCLYLVSCCSYLPEPDDTAVLEVAHRIYTKMGKHHDALRVALRINDPDVICSTFAGCADPLEKKQLAYLLARHGHTLDLEDGPAAVEDDGLRDSLREIISNSKLSEHYLALARDLDVMEPKVPEDVYKSHLIEGRQPQGPAVDSARQNLASTLVNAFVNAGFGTDKLVTPSSEGSGGDNIHWIFKNKDHGKTAATASLGLISLWDVEGGLPAIDKYLYSTDQYVVAGALMAIGIVNCCVQNENDPAFALICDYVTNADPGVRAGAVLGLGLAYAGTRREEVAELLVPLVVDTEVSMEVSGFAALALGLVFASSCKEDLVEAVLTALMSRGEAELSGPFAKYLVLGLGLLFLGKQETVEATVEIAKTLSERVSRYCQVVLDGLAYAGSGNVLKVQELLALCGEHPQDDDDKPDGGSGGGEWRSAHQFPAVLGIALIAMGEPLGAKMAARTLEHLLQYGEPIVRRAVPLATALLSPSDPDASLMDTLSRLSHDADTEVAQNAVVALGIVGAGTNNARLAGILRGLSSYYYKEPTLLYLVRTAQGLVHMGKGLLGLSPFHTERQLLSGVALAGLLAVVFSCEDAKQTLAGKYPHLFYCLAAAMKPRMLLTLDEEGALLPAQVRVGTAVDVVAQAGRPKTITGFQTHTTPVLMSAGERAELATEQYVPLSPLLEGVVLLRKNPDFMDVAE
ncbi:MAG: 26S proteasome regulatory complex [Monoraphidium minutum]|nr:MAG: 26S proteasome regulatory complex [Monoraphidium minutum]